MIFLFLEQIALSRAANARRFLQMLHGENGVMTGFGPQLNSFMSAGISLK